MIRCEAGTGFRFVGKLGRRQCLCWAVRRMEAGRGRGAEIETVFGAYVGRIVGRHNRELLQLERRLPLLDAARRAQTPPFAEPGSSQWQRASRRLEHARSCQQSSPRRTARWLAPPSPPRPTKLCCFVSLTDVDAAAAYDFYKLRWRGRPLYSLCPDVLVFSPAPACAPRKPATSSGGNSFNCLAKFNKS